MTTQDYWNKHDADVAKGYGSWCRWNPIPNGLLDWLEGVGDAGLCGDLSLCWTLLFPPAFMLIGGPLIIVSPLFTWWTDRWRKRHQWPRYAPWGGISHLDEQPPVPKPL